jgi:aminomethyltransferase
VELADVTNERAGVVIIGPQTEAILDKFVTGEPVLPPILHIIQMQRIRHNDLLLHAESPQVPRFELWLQEPGDADTLKRELKEGGISEASDEDLEHLRILSGTPLYGTDIRDKDLPQETNQTRALHFAKGCYLGQEIVERIRSRGQVHRTFTGFVLAGDLPQPGTALTDENAKAVGELTSVTTIGGQMLALGYLRREARDRGALIQYPGGTATPSEVPFSLAITSGNEPSHHVR